MTAPELRRRRFLANTVLAAAVLFCASLAAWPPARASFYLRCPIHEYLDLLCPGCGATRALAALLHGQFEEALRLNAFFVLLLPIVLAAAVESYRRAVRPGSFRWPHPPVPALYATLAAAAIFTIARNVL